MNFEWAHILIAVAGLLGGALAGLVVGVWRVAHIEQEVRNEFKECIDETRREIGEKVESLVGQFQETFAGIRQKINDVELQTEKLFMSKDGFNEFRREYREDMSSLMKKIDHLAKRPER